METAWIALIATLFGGAGLKIIESVLARGQKRVDTATQLREELRREGEALKKDAAELREEIRKVEQELDAWKEKYFILLQEFLEIKSQLAHEPKESDPEW
jgi:predicted phage gp36 major capsid-like protein